MTVGNALEHVPEALKTPEMCFTAVQSPKPHYMPREYVTFRYVPEELKTLEMCLVAIQNDPKALEYVPKMLQKKIRAAMKKAKAESVQEYCE